MTKIVYNASYGSFDLSDVAVKLYAAKKGITLYPEVVDDHFTIYWLVPEGTPDRHVPTGTHEPVLVPDEIDRTDPVLVEVVELLGSVANGCHANLAIRELPAGTAYRIHEYDGFEAIIRQDEYQWRIA